MAISSRGRLYGLFSLLIFLIVQCSGLIHELTIKDDSRKHFLIENFGFETGGVLEMTIKDWRVSGQPWIPTEDDEKSAGFLIKVTETDSTAFLEEGNAYSYKPGDYFDPDTDDTNQKVYIQSTNLTHLKLTVKDNMRQGIYNTFFINGLDRPVSFHLRLEQFNVDAYGVRNYLSVGMAHLPTMYLVFAVVYAGLCVVWVVRMLRGDKTQMRINKVHHFMTSLLLLKMLSLLFQAIDLHFTKISGHPGGWAIVYYIFTALKTMTFFTLIALIGSGFYFIKPFLSEKDMKILMVVIPLQVIDNIALIVVGETAPGSQDWLTWKDIFKLVDLICCGAVLIPIIWSIKHLREASEIDGKAALNLSKLKLFRQFYLIVVSYIYFTRIIIYLLDETLPFRFVWVGELFNELGALVFFCVVGYKFRPTLDNPYFRMSTEDENALRMEELGTPAGSRNAEDDE